MPQNLSTILTEAEVKLIQDALKRAYKPKLLKETEQNVAKAEKEHPLGTPGSVKIYDKGDGAEAEGSAIDKLIHSKNKKDVALGKQIDALLHNAGLEETGTKFADKHPAVRDQIIALEEASSMAATFKAARKIQRNGRD